MTTQFSEVRIEELCSRVTAGSTPLRSRVDYYEGGTIDWYKTGELRDWYLPPAEERITEKAIVETSVKLFPADTVLMAMYGDGKTITSLGMLRKPAATNQACAAMLVDETRCSPRYFFYALQGRRDSLIKLASGGAQRNLSGKLIKDFRLPVPPLSTQHRIASILSAYDELIENCQRRIKILESMARALYRKWFVHFRFPGHENHPRVASPLGEIPQGWEVKKLAELVTTQYGYTESANESPVGPKYLRGMDMNKASFIDWSKVPYCPISEEDKASYAVRRGDVFVIRMADPGKVGIAEQDVDGVFASYLIRLRPKGERLLPYFLFHLLDAPAYQGFISGASTGTTRKSASAGVITDFSFALPPASLISDFEVRAAAFRRMLTALLLQIETLRRTRDLLLPRLLSGQIELQAS